MLKKISALCLVGVMLLALCSCTTEQPNPLYSSLTEDLQSPSHPPSDSKQTLTFAIQGSLNEFNYLYNFVTTYMDEHPDVLIQVETIDENDLSTQLMAGYAPDVIINYASSTLLESGHLVDLYHYIENDPEFQEEDYFMNVLSSQETNGHLYAMAYNFYFVGIFAMRNDFDSEAAEWFECAETVTYADMMRLYQEASSDLEIQFYQTFGPDDVWDFYLDSAIDFEHKSCTFQSQELSTTLEMARAIPAPNVEYSLESGTLVSTPSMSSLGALQYLDATSSYLFSRCDVFTEPEILFPYENKLFTLPRVIASGNGNYLYQVCDSFMMTDSCKNQELAWDFIKFCFSARQDPLEGFDTLIGHQLAVGMFPTVNRKTFAAQCRNRVEVKYEHSVENGLIPTGSREKVITDAVNYLMGLPEYLEISLSPYHSALSITWEDRCLFYWGRQSLDVTLENIQSKVTLYLNE